MAARAINLHKTPDDVFALVSNIENAATWRLGLHKIELLPSAEGQIRFREVTDDGTIAYEMAGSHLSDWLRGFRSQSAIWRILDIRNFSDAGRLSFEYHREG